MVSRQRQMSEIRTVIAKYNCQVHDTKRPIIITQHGKSVAVLMGSVEYEAMQEKKERLTHIQKSLSQIGNGQGIDHGKAMEMVLKKAVHCG